MRWSTRIALVAGTVLLIALFVLWRIAATPIPPEDQQVRERLEEVRLAIVGRDLNTVMDAISNDFDALGYTRERLRLEAAAAFRRGIHSHIRYSDVGVNVVGKESTVTMRVEVSWEEQGYLNRHEPMDVRLYLRKEPAKKWLVVPTEKWRVVSVEGVNLGELP